jgi:hypothetical protein
MRPRRARSDDVLFISALAAVIIGIGLLLYTTGAAPGALRAWPLLVLGIGGALVYFALAWGASNYFFFGGILLFLAGLLFILGRMASWSLSMAWPLFMASAGISWLVAGLREWRRIRAVFAAPSIGFVLLGAVFSLFSFKIVEVGLGQFVREWWPSLLIAGGLSLFAAFGLSRRGSAGGGREGPRPGSRAESPARHGGEDPET